MSAYYLIISVSYGLMADHWCWNYLVTVVWFWFRICICVNFCFRRLWNIEILRYDQFNYRWITSRMISFLKEIIVKRNKKKIYLFFLGGNDLHNTHIKVLCTVDGVYDMQVIIIINEVMKDIMTTPICKILITFDYPKHQTWFGRHRFWATAFRYHCLCI